MSVRDWDIVDGVALRQVNGKQVVVTPGSFIDIEAAIKDPTCKVTNFGCRIRAGRRYHGI